MTHRLLSRQLKRFLGIDSPEQLAAIQEELLKVAARPDVEAGSAVALAGLSSLFEAVEQAYEQSDRDLALRTRSLEISSAELTAANARLAQDLAARQETIDSLREIANHMLRQTGLPAISALDGSLEALTQLLSDLVMEREANQKQLRDALSSLEQQKSALDQHAIVSITDVDGTILYANDRFVEISGYSRAEMLGQNHRILNSGRHPRKFFTELWKTISSGRVWRGDICNRAKDGSRYWVTATIVPFLDGTGRPYQYVAIRNDITSRIAVEEKLDAQLHFTQELVENIPVPIYFKDTEGRYLGFNKAFEEFFGLERSEWIGRHVYDLLPPELAEFHASRDLELMRTRQHQSYETEVVTRQGTKRHAFYSKAPLTNPDGSSRGMVGTIIDISERKRWESEILQAKEAAEAANRIKSDFLANMSHEIRTPMNGIIGMTELTLDTELDAEQREYLEAVKRSADSLLTVINDILDFSKIEAGKLDVESIPFDLDPVVADALRTVALRAEQKGLELLVDVAPDVPARLLGDPGRLRQILLNLLSNAVKFTERGEVVLTVTTECREGDAVRLHFAVRDSGVGIAAEKCQLIFEPFAQEDSSTTRNYGGTGLGLTICSRLVELMGGRIWVESQVGNGSTFRFTVQARCLPGTLETPDLPDGLRALVAVHHPDQARILQGHLARWGAESLWAGSDADLLRLATRGEGGGGGVLPFDLCVLDVDLPLALGQPLAATLTAAGVAPEAVILLSRPSAPSGGELREWGAPLALARPATAGELGRALVRWIGGEESGTRPVRALHVLVAEDHPVNQRLITNLLERLGHRVTLAENGEEAVNKTLAAWAADEAPDLVLMDVQMPCLGGLEATARIRAAEAEAGRGRVPVYALSAAAEDIDREAGNAAGLDGYLGKPLTRDDLLAVLAGIAGEEVGRGGIPIQGARPENYARLLGQMDADILSIIGDVFLDQAPRDTAALKAALAASDWKTLFRVAHTIKGSVSNFGNGAVVRQAAALEEEAAAGAADPARVRALVAELERFCAALKEFLAVSSA